MLESLLIKITVKRLEKKFSQNYMASQLNISQSFYNKIENGKTELSVKNLLKIAILLDIDKIEIYQNHKSNSNVKIKKELIIKPEDEFVIPSTTNNQEINTK